MKRRSLGALTAAVLLVGACGGNPSEPTSGGNIALTDTTNATLLPAATCDVPIDSILGQMNDATFAIVAEVQVPQPDGTTQAINALIGTAWAVRDHLLATNAHVTEAFRDLAAQGVQASAALGVQSRTGSVIHLTQAATHPDYTGDPLGSPDVGFFATRELLPVTLPLAEEPDLRLGDEILIVGFPGDVNQFIEIVPGQTVPQATSLRGQVTALRSHDLTQMVTGENLDVIQHQAPTTPGTSGSAMVACDKVVAVNNAGTVQLIVTPTPDGDLSVDRAAAANNNFAVHVRHLHALLALNDSQQLTFFPLPVPAATEPNGSPGGQPGTEPAIVGTWLGVVASGPAEHTFAFAIDETGGIVGLSEWEGTGQFELVGQIQPDGSFRITDNAPERLGFRRGIYEGVMDRSGNAVGTYFEETMENQRFDFQAQRTR